MYCIACPPVLQLFDRPAELAQQWAIDGFEFAARGHDRDESRYPVNGCPELRFALPQRPFRPLALCQIEHECKALVASFFEQSGANKHRNAAAVFPNILLLEGPNSTG